jgi:hypothetical protein
MLAGLLLSGSVALSVAQLPPPEAATAQKTVAPPFSKLFLVTPPQEPRPREQQPTPPERRDARQRPQTKVVCGMTVMIVDGSPDPAIAHETPKAGTIFPMRRVPPRVCGPE